MTKFLIANLLVLLLGSIWCKEHCPDKETLSPCTCQYNEWDDSIELLCSDVEGTPAIDLAAVFDKISKNLQPEEKKFDRLNLNNMAMTVLKANTFKDITFNEIYVISSLNLQKIEQNAFGGTNKVTTTIEFLNNPKLDDSAKALFEVLNEFESLVTITLQYNQLNEIPANAFKPELINSSMIATLIIQDSTISSIGDNAFQYLKNIKILKLLDTAISHIPENAFNIESGSDSLQLFIASSELTDESFAINSLTKLNRKTLLDISGKNHVTVLNEKVFLPFLEANKNNQLVCEDKIDCSNCLSYWARNNTAVESNISVKNGCVDGHEWLDKNNFKLCH